MSATSVDAGETVTRPCLRRGVTCLPACPAPTAPDSFPLGYVEVLNDARTKLAVVFSVLLDRQESGVEVGSLGCFGRSLPSVSRGFLVTVTVWNRA